MILGMLKQQQKPYEWGDSHMPSRPVDKEKAEQELSQNVKKAVTAEEVAPKAKHVRKCILYTWDYHTALSVYNSLRVLPILSDEIMTFKALILVHKVIQEGHACAIKEGQNQVGWLETCSRTMGSEGARGYSSLIRSYVNFIIAKLRFHKNHPEFNGLFEYEEYISLKGIDDPNEGFETINDLMTLQDQIDSFQKLIFAHFKMSGNNEVRISALVPLVKESYGIYRFITSMARALHRKTGAVEALEPVRQRYNAQHYNLRKFYYECSNLKYLTTLITVPKLPRDPPDLLKQDEPSLPERPKTAQPQVKAAKSPEPVPRNDTPTEDIEEQIRMLKHYEDQQAALKAKQDKESRQRAEAAERQQREFEDQQRIQAERERQAQEQLQRQQMNSQQAGRTAELEREILAMRGQYERDQMMLEQYDRRVKQLEMEMQAINQNISQQMQAKDEMIRGIQDQGNLWRSKYEALAKLYSQLRNEHLDLLNKMKGLQLKANSAQEAIDKMERMERDMKNKNLELADMIRERDRARFEMDRLKSSNKDELERTKRDLRFAEERAQDATRSKSSEVHAMLQKYTRQLNELEDSLREKQQEIDALHKRLDETAGEAERVRDEKDMEIQIMKEGMDETILQMASMQNGEREQDQVMNAQIDELILDNMKKLNAIIDSVLQAGVQKIDDAMYELESTMQEGNRNATPAYLLSMIEKSMTSANEFATVFDLYLEGQKGGEHVEVIKTANNYAQAIADTLASTKGVTRFCQNDDAVDKLIRVGKAPGDSALKGLLALQSYKLENLKLSGRKDVVIRGNMDVRSTLTKLSAEVEALVPKQTKSARANGDIGDLVEQEMNAAARAIEQATQKLQDLMNRQTDTSRHSAVDIQVHDAILASAMAITQAIGRLIQAATESQNEIVAQGRGSSSAQAFYKRNNRWTDGLISAAKAVAFATTLLIETADGVISGTHNLEQLIVASNEVAAATAQLVQASRVKSELMSRTQEHLEKAAKAVTDACKALVRQVKAITAKDMEGRDDMDYASMGNHELKMREMEIQVEVLTKEKELTDARRRLASLRKTAYQESDL